MSPCHWFEDWKVYQSNFRYLHTHLKTLTHTHTHARTHAHTHVLALTPTVAVPRWIQEKQPWAPWTVDGEVAGYVTQYAKNFTFTTLKDAGHLCPRTAPIRAFTMFDRFISGAPLTTNIDSA